MNALLYCGDCGVRLRVKRNGVVIDRLSQDRSPYQAYHGDVLECPECGFSLLKTAAEPGTESHRPDYEQVVAGADYTVIG